MAGASFIGEQAPLAIMWRSRREEALRSKAARRALAAVAVALLHVVFVLVLLRAEWLPEARQLRSAEPPLIWLLIKAPPGVQLPKLKQEKKDERQAQPNTIVLPITPPPRPVPDNSFNPATALGDALACGASSYEYLPVEQRAKCKSQPWHYRFDKFGNIILDAEARPPPPEHHETGAEAQQRMMNTIDPCAAARATNSPCLDQVINGGAPHY